VYREATVATRWNLKLLEHLLQILVEVLGADVVTGTTKSLQQL
jgi:hypothetical protein